MDRAIIFVIDIVHKAGYRCPRIILTDNGGKLMNKLIKGIYSRENAVGESFEDNVYHENNCTVHYFVLHSFWPSESSKVTTKNYAISVSKMLQIKK